MMIVNYFLAWYFFFISSLNGRLKLKYKIFSMISYIQIIILAILTGINNVIFLEKLERCYISIIE